MSHHMFHAPTIPHCLISRRSDNIYIAYEYVSLRLFVFLCGGNRCGIRHSMRSGKVMDGIMYGRDLFTGYSQFIDPRNNYFHPLWRLRQSQSTPTQMSDTQQCKDPRETHPTNSASEDDSSSEYQPDDEPTLLNLKAADEENQPPSEAGESTPDMQTFGTTAANHQESATQSAEPAAETTHLYEGSQPTAKKGEEFVKSCGQEIQDGSSSGQESTKISLRILRSPRQQPKSHHPSSFLLNMPNQSHPRWLRKQDPCKAFSTTGKNLRIFQRGHSQLANYRHSSWQWSSIPRKTIKSPSTRSLRLVSYQTTAVERSHTRSLVSNG